MTVLDLFRLDNRIAVVTGGAQGIDLKSSVPCKKPVHR